MAVALRTLGHYIKDATHLQTGKPFQNFGDMRSREAVANWLLCATANAIDGRNLSVASTNDAIGGDGIIHDEDTGESFQRNMSWFRTRVVAIMSIRKRLS